MLKKVERCYSKAKKLVLYKAFISADLQQLTVNSNMDTYTFEFTDSVLLLANEMPKDQVANLKGKQIVVLEIQLVNDDKDLIKNYNDDGISVSLSITNMEKKGIQLFECDVKEFMLYEDEDGNCKVSNFKLEITNAESVAETVSIVYNKDEQQEDSKDTESQKLEDDDMTEVDNNA